MATAKALDKTKSSKDASTFCINLNKVSSFMVNLFLTEDTCRLVYMHL